MFDRYCFSVFFQSGRKFVIPLFNSKKTKWSHLFNRFFLWLLPTTAICTKNEYRKQKRYYEIVMINERVTFNPDIHTYVVHRFMTVSILVYMYHQLTTYVYVNHDSTKWPQCILRPKRISRRIRDEIRRSAREGNQESCSA